MISDQMGAKIGTEKLRRLVGTLAGGMEPLRAEAQVQKLKELIDKARESKQKPVLSVSRDGVSLGLAPWSFFEMADGSKSLASWITIMPLNVSRRSPTR